MTSSLMEVYRPLPIRLVKGEGVYVYDDQNKKYLDALAGIAVTNLGHCHPEVVKTMQEQVSKIIHTSNVLNVPVQHDLANKLVQLSSMEQVFFANSGAEANECAIKLARMYGNKSNVTDPCIIVMDKAFHGRSLATLTASGSRKVQAGFEPLVRGFIRAPFNDLDSIHAIAKNSHNVVAILVEPIQCEGGIQIPDDNYLQGIREICDQNNWLMMLDEIQTGIGRTGKWFAHQHANIIPDVMTLAKALGNGVPIAACLTKGKAVDLFQVGNHGSTYGGNPFCCATSLKVLETLEAENAIENSATIGDYLNMQLQEQIKPLAPVVDIRSKGLLIGIELDKPCRDLLPKAADEGLLFSITADKVIRLVPPLILTKKQADFIVDVLIKIIK